MFLWMIPTLIQNGISDRHLLTISLNKCRNDILRKHGVIPEKPPSPTPMIQEALQEARKQAYENRLEDKDLDELNDIEDEEDEAFLDGYRYVISMSETRGSSLT